ncbi:MAG: Co2+/Mg2+ efflux protein ApaG [Phycisphaeraceae bacterium]|nr:MAG: Co2+/Mg2+ efflux protein ApaG [Phycisphaeraceae bacterium]
MPRTADNPRPLGSERSTHGLLVAVRPSFLPERSNKDRGVFVFAYHITITNTSDTPARLMARHWIIVDANAKKHVVRGEGVVGQQPRLLPGQSFEYASFCPLPTHWGTMEGAFRFQRDDGSHFNAQVARFYLAAPPDPAPPGPASPAPG